MTTIDHESDRTAVNEPVGFLLIGRDNVGVNFFLTKKNISQSPRNEGK